MSEDLKRAGYMPVQNGKENPILIVTNCIRPKIEKYSRKFPKYKKIGKEAKIKLIKLVSSGYPIINVYYLVI